jgi:hypothetical protein
MVALRSFRGAAIYGLIRRAYRTAPQGAQGVRRQASRAGPQQEQSSSNGAPARAVGCAFVLARKVRQPASNGQIGWAKVNSNGCTSASRKKGLFLLGSGIAALSLAVSLSTSAGSAPRPSFLSGEEATAGFAPFGGSASLRSSKQSVPSRRHARSHAPDSAVSTVTIKVGTTANMSCTGTAPVICSPTGQNAILATSTLQKLLASSNVVVNTGTNGSQAADIDVNGPLTWTAATMLTLDSDHSIIVNNPVKIEGTGSSAGLTIITDDGGSGGTLSFGAKGYVNFWDTASTFVSGPYGNEITYTLVNSMNTNIDTLGALATRIANDPTGNFALGYGYNAISDGQYSGAVVTQTFSGNFEGLGNTISYLSVIDGGLFLEVESPATVSDVRLANIKITGTKAGLLELGGLANVADNSISSGTLFSGDTVSGSINVATASNGCLQAYIGGLVGLSNVGETTIANSSSTAAIHVSDFCGVEVGGLIGGGGPIANSFAKGSITVTTTNTQTLGQAWVGGLEGGSTGQSNNGQSIEQSYATDNITVSGQSLIVGGLVGYFADGVIDRSFATGNVKATAKSNQDPAAAVGGLIGLTEDDGVNLTNSFATGSVTAADQTLNIHNVGFAASGGLVGYDASSSNGGSNYQYVYATGAVSASASGKAGSRTYAGGLIGIFSFNTIDQAYASGTVSTTGGYTGAVGGFLGFQTGVAGTITDSYWDTDTGGLQGIGSWDGGSYDLTGQTTSQFLSGVPPKFDTSWIEGTLNGGFPYLIANPPPK